MKLQILAQSALAVAIVVAFSPSIEAQTFQGAFQIQEAFQSGTIINTQQPTEEDKAKADIGADFYDAGIAVGIRSVFTNGPAQKAGLQSGDMLTKANGEAIQNAAGLKAMIQGKAAGETIKLTRNKNGKEDEVEVKLATLGDVMKASNVPEPGAYDQAIQQSEQRIASLDQQVENLKADLEEMQKQIADQQKRLEDLKTRAEESRVAAEKQKAEEAAKRAADEAKAKEEAAAREAAIAAENAKAIKAMEEAKAAREKAKADAETAQAPQPEAVKEVKKEVKKEEVKKEEVKKEEVKKEDK